MKYILSEKYNDENIINKIMGPNSIKLCEELLLNSKIPAGAKVCDLGSGQGITSVFMVKEYGYMVYACDLWEDPEERILFFREMGLDETTIIPVKADAKNMPFEKAYFDAVVSVDSYQYFGRDSAYLDDMLLPYVKEGGYIYIAVPGMKKDCHDNLPPELLLSWTREQLDSIHDIAYWTNLIQKSKHCEIVEISEMLSNDDYWADWLKQENEYAIRDRKSMEAGGGKYLNFIKIVLKKK